MGNLLLLVLDEPTMLTLSLAVALAPFTLAMALKLTVFLACSMTSFAIGDRGERAELLACAIGRLQPSSAGEMYREAMLAEIRHAIRHAPPEQVPAIASNLLVTAPRTILAAWVRIPRPLWERAREAVGPSAGRPGS